MRTLQMGFDTGLWRTAEFVRLYAPDLAYLCAMKSMTGYGRGDCSKDGFKITVELSSVNRKQTEISVTLPREMEMIEAQIRDLINRHIARGRLTARVSLHAGSSNTSARMHLNVPSWQPVAKGMMGAEIRDLINRHIVRGRLTVRVSLHAGSSKTSARMHLNVPLAKAYARELNHLAKQLKLPGPVTLDQLARAPGVLQTDEELAVEEDFWPAVEKALQQALSQLVKMRVREGAHLAQDLTKRIAVMRESAAQIQKQAPTVGG